MPKTGPTESKSALNEILQWLTARQREMVEQVRELVVRESPTHDKQACDALCDYLAQQFEALGGQVKIHRQPKAGNHLQVDFAGPRGTQAGSAAGTLRHRVRPRNPGDYAVARGERTAACGPGVFDMKSGIAQIMFALRALREIKGGCPRPVIVWLVSDEEEGSDSSRALTEKLAAQCEAVFVCEPAGPGGALKTARKGVGGFVIKVTGQASHSGLDFEKGQSAILELSHQIQAVSRLTDLKRGITLNVGVIRGGTRTNVVAAEAMAEVDLRIARKSDGPVMERKVKALRPVNKKCKLHIEGGVNRPPLERTKQVAALFQLAQENRARSGLPAR